MTLEELEEDAIAVKAAFDALMGLRRKYGV
jgi:hypothetical protein